jgi:hypothetical protein
VNNKKYVVLVCPAAISYKTGRKACRLPWVVRSPDGVNPMNEKKELQVFVGKQLGILPQATLRFLGEARPDFSGTGRICC